MGLRATQELLTVFERYLAMMKWLKKTPSEIVVTKAQMQLVRESVESKWKNGLSKDKDGYKYQGIIVRIFDE